MKHPTTAITHVRPHERWPSGDSRPIAVLALDPDELATRHGVIFDDAIDDLDRVQLAAIGLADGSQLWLSKHLGDPNPGTVVRIDAAADPVAARVQLLGALGLDGRTFRWTSDGRG